MDFGLPTLCSALSDSLFHGIKKFDHSRLSLSNNNDIVVDSVRINNKHHYYSFYICYQNTRITRTKIKTITVMEIITATMILIVIMVTITAIIKTVIMGTVITLGPIPYPRPYTILRKEVFLHSSLVSGLDPS